MTLGSEKACRDAGKIGIEGKEYVVQDGDIMHFLFNVSPLEGHSGGRVKEKKTKKENLKKHTVMKNSEVHSSGHRSRRLRRRTRTRLHL